MSRGNYKNPCLTMHQPWASLLVHGIKRIEGRSWPSPIRGRLWIHAASKVPDEATIKAMEDFYREIYAVDGVTEIQFPQHYPVSRLIGCVEVVGCVTCDELQHWEALPEGVRLEGQTNFCWLCEKPQKLIIPFEMRGYQGVYNLENKIYVAAARGLTLSQNHFAFPLPYPENPSSLKPNGRQEKKPVETEQLTSAIAGARAAATQFSKKGPSLHINSTGGDYMTRSKRKGIEEDAKSTHAPDLCITRSKNKDSEIGGEGCSGSSSNKVEDDTKPKLNSNVESNKRSVATTREVRNASVVERRFDPGSARIMAAAIRNLKPSS